MVCLAGEVLVDQVEWVPLEVGVFIHVSTLAVGGKLLVWHQAQIEIQSRLETFGVHPLPTVP